jgi:hypothetical protein
MRRLSGRPAGLGAIKIVAIGSSTTAGEGDIAPTPSGSNALRAGSAGRNIGVLNRDGGGGRPSRQRKASRPFRGHYSNQGSMAAQLFWAEEERHLAVFRVNRKVDLSQGLYERHSKCVLQK